MLHFQRESLIIKNTGVVSEILIHKSTTRMCFVQLSVLFFLFGLKLLCECLCIPHWDGFHMAQKYRVVIIKATGSNDKATTCRLHAHARTHTQVNKDIQEKMLIRCL